MKRALKIIAIVVAVLIVVIVALPFVINVNSFRPRIESELTTALGRKVTVGNLSLSIFSGSLGADDIAIADDPAASAAGEVVPSDWNADHTIEDGTISAAKLSFTLATVATSGDHADLSNIGTNTIPMP